MLLIYGKGKVGIGVAGLCDALGIAYQIADDSQKVDYSLFDDIIPSPGVPSNHDVYKTGKVKSELDFAFEYLPKDFHIVAVTGTDGKSTTSWIMYNILLQEFGEGNVYLSGNFDVPFSATVREILKKGQTHGYIVVEVSSFMSYSLHAFSPEYSIFTNLKVDHLNWHTDLQEYLDAKMQLVAQTRKKSFVNTQVFEFAKVNNLIIQKHETIVFFAGNIIESGNYYSDDGIYLTGVSKYQLSATPLTGDHNGLNLLASALVAESLGISPEYIASSLKTIRGLPHRIEFVCKKGEVDFIDDSKSTSCQSLMAALSAFELSKLILIAGGSDKGDPFDELDMALRGVKYCVLIGATRELLGKKCSIAGVPFVFADSMDAAVEDAYSHSHSGDTVLLSPGCASFGLFRDYLDRAEKFRDAIKKLP